jgi:hypothetical protein
VGVFLQRVPPKYRARHKKRVKYQSVMYVDSDVTVLLRSLLCSPGALLFSDRRQFSKRRNAK